MRIQFQTEEHTFKTGGQIFRATGSSLYRQPAGRCPGHCWPIFHHNHIHKAQEHTLLKHYIDTGEKRTPLVGNPGFVPSHHRKANKRHVSEVKALGGSFGKDKLYLPFTQSIGT